VYRHTADGEVCFCAAKTLSDVSTHCSRQYASSKRSVHRDYSGAFCRLQVSCSRERCLYSGCLSRMQAECRHWRQTNKPVYDVVRSLLTTGIENQTRSLSKRSKPCLTYFANLKPPGDAGEPIATIRYTLQSRCGRINLMTSTDVISLDQLSVRTTWHFEENTVTILSYSDKNSRIRSILNNSGQNDRQMTTDSQTDVD